MPRETPVTQVTQKISAGLSPARETLPGAPPRPWQLPAQGLAVFYGSGQVARLSHYFLPRLLAENKRVLMLDGANAADPRLVARFARERGVEFAAFSRRIQIARAFTCFQLTELIRRVPRFLASFPAQVLIVTALPDLYFDEDVRDADARVAFEQALAGLRRCANLPLAVAVFSSAPDFAPSPARRRFFERTSAAATEVWRFDLHHDFRPQLVCERSLSFVRGQLPARNSGLGIWDSGFGKGKSSARNCEPRLTTDREPRTTDRSA
jgi:hypothetical protein